MDQTAKFSGRIRHLPALATAVAWCMLSGCAVPSSTPETAAPRPGSPGFGEQLVVEDLIPKLESARVLRATKVVLPGEATGAEVLIQGWGGPEVQSESAASFAWVVAREARIDVVRLDRGPARIAVTGWPFRWSGAPEQTVEVIVNGSSVGSRGMARGESTLVFDVPEGTFDVGVNAIDLKFGRTGKPAAVIPGSTDGRTLAAAIRRIEISGSGPADEASEPFLERRGSSVLLSPGTGASFRYRLAGDLGLDLEIAGVGGEDPVQQRIVVWQQPLGGQPTVLLDEVLTSRPSKRHIALQPVAGQLSEFVVSAVGGGVSVDRMQLVGSGTVEAPRNLLLIVIDTLRADRVGCYQGEASTPAIDGLAEHGTLFERAYAHIAITGPSHASMFTSLYPFEHGVHNNAQILSEEHQTLAETLRRHGWFTAGVVSLGVLMGDYGMAQGFDVYRDRFDRDWMKNAGEITDEALAEVQEGLPQPYFMWVHYSDPHEPYTPPGLDYPLADVELDDQKVAAVTADGRGYSLDLDVVPGRNRLRFVLQRPDPRNWYRVGAVTLRSKQTELVAPASWTVIKDAAGFRTYTAQLPALLELINDGDQSERVQLHFIFKRRLDIPQVKDRYRLEVEYADREIGRLLAELERRGLLDNTLVVVTSDHGEGLGDHNHLGHIHQVYDSLTRVPLIISDNGRPFRVGRVPDRVGLVDLFPTVAEILGVDGPSPASGRSLVPLLEGISMPERDIIAETYRPEAFTDKRSIIRHGVKFIHSWSDVRGWEELYDLVSDPGELDNLVEQRPALAQGLSRALENRLRETHHGRSERAELSASDVDRLRALGYVH